MDTLKKMVCIFLSAVILWSCSDEKTEKKLDGIWHGECMVEDDDGDAMTLKMTMVLDRQSHEFELKLNVHYPIVGRVATIRFDGTWKADEEDIMIDVDDKFISVKFDAGIVSLAQMLGVNAHLLEKQMSAELKDEISGFCLMPIKSLSSSEMVLEMFDSYASFEKEKSAYGYEAPEPYEEISIANGNDCIKASLSISYYEGTVAGQPVKMELDYSEGFVTGRYCYSKYAEWLNLEGTYDGENLIMDETAPNGDVTGSFELTVDHLDGHVSLLGSMTNSRGKSYSVALQEMN